MISTATDVCNLALARLGSHASLVDLDEGTAEARAAKLIYDQSIAAALRRHDWSFATGRVALALSGAAPADWTYSYALPADCLKARYLTIPAAGVNIDPEQFEVSGRFLFSNAAAAVLCYTRRITDVTQWDASFVDAALLKLCADLAAPITGRQELMREFSAQWRAYMPEAAAIDSNEAKGQRNQEAAWIQARGGY